MPNLRRVAWGVLVTIALIGVWSNASLERDTSKLLAETTVMNITDRQRLYAEEVARHAWQLVTALSTPDRQQARTRLKLSVAGMRKGQGAWLRATAPADPQATVSGLDVEVQGYLAAANSILLTPDEQLKRRNTDVRWLEQQATGPLISVLDRAITALEDQGEAHIRSMKAAARLRLLCVIALLIILGQGVFRPLERRIRRAQEELTAERDFAQQVMTTAAQGLTVTGAHGRFEYVNPAFARLLGVEAHTLLGRTPFDVTCSDSHPALREALLQRSGGEITTYETQLRRTDGAAVPVLITGAPRMVAGLRTGSIASVTDLTEQKRNEQTFRSLAALSHSLEQAQTPEDVARRALQLLSQKMELAWLTLYHQDGEQFAPQTTCGHLPAGRAAPPILALERTDGLIRDTLAGRALYRTGSHESLFPGLGVSSVALVPLPPGQASGTQMLCAVRTGETRPWTPPERALLETAARSVAAALRRAELHLEAQDAAEFARTLLAISALVESEFDPTVVAAEVLSRLGPALDMNRASVLLVRDEHVEVVSAWPPDEPVLRVPVTQGSASWQPTVGQGHPVTIIDGPGLNATAPTSVAWVVLATVQETEFLLVGSRPQPSTSWSPRDRALLAAAARTVRVAWERQGRFRQVEHAALTDVLTGLGNRRALNRALDELGARTAEPFGLLSLDLDGLKQINDTFGHDCGDRLLQEFACALKDSFREQDLVFRLGGDEFMVLLPGCRQEQAQSMLDRVQTASERVRPLPKLMGCGASAGAAFWPDDGQQITHLVACADERMYEHKRRRKNRPVAGQT